LIRTPNAGDHCWGTVFEAKSQLPYRAHYRRQRLEKRSEDLHSTLRHVS
jgi:hypothetical protein